MQIGLAPLLISWLGRFWQVVTVFGCINTNVLGHQVCSADQQKLSNDALARAIFTDSCAQPWLSFTPTTTLQGTCASHCDMVQPRAIPTSFISTTGTLRLGPLPDVRFWHVSVVRTRSISSVIIIRTRLTPYLSSICSCVLRCVFNSRLLPNLGC